MTYNLTPVVCAYLNARELLEGMDRHHACAFFNLYLKDTPIEFSKFYTAILEHARRLDVPLPRFGLIQEEFMDDPWKLLVVCCLLNLTNVRQVWCVVDELFDKYPSCRAIDDNVYSDLRKLLAPLGLSSRKATGIIRLSKAWVTFDGVDVLCLPTVGPYARDSYAIFIEKNYDIVPSDKELIKYLAWRHTC